MGTSKKVHIKDTKIKTKADFVKSANHNLRKTETPNTDKTRENQNQHSFNSQVFSKGQSPDILDVTQLFDDRLKNIRVRKNAVQCVEFFLGCSPESFENKQDYNNYLVDSKQWLDKKFGAKNVILASIHHDETTPHLAAYVLPIVIKKGKETLNARKYFGTSELLSNLQTEFFEKVGKHHGLERGVKKSKLKHTSATEFATAISKPIDKVPTTLELMNPITAKNLQKKWETMNYQLMNAQLKIENYEQERIAHDKDNERLKRQAEEKTQLLIESQKSENYAVERKSELEHLSYRAFGNIIKKTFAPQELEEIFDVKLKGKQDIFDALMKAKKAISFEMAVKYVLELLPEKFRLQWNELDYPPEPKIEFTPSDSGKTKGLPVMKAST